MDSFDDRRRSSRRRTSRAAAAALLVVAALALVLALPAGALAATNPHITSVSPGFGIPGASVTVTGFGFGATQGGANVWFNEAGVADTGANSPTIVSWSDTRIVCIVPTPPAFGPQLVMVWEAGQTYSNEVAFTTQNGALWVTGTAPRHAAAGARVTVHGWGFGSTQGLNYLALWGFPNTIIPTPTLWSDATIQFTIAPGMATGKHQMYVWNNGLSMSSNLVLFSIDPAITALSPKQAYPGATVTITGTGFGKTRGTSKVYFGAKAATSYVSWSNTKIKVKVPLTSAGSHPAKVKTKFGTTKTKAFKVL